jgi:predicted secreted protein
MGGYSGSQAFAGRGSQLQRGNGASPQVYTPIAELKKITRSGSKADMADVTNMESGAYREVLPTLLTPGEISFEGNYIPADATQQQMQSDFNNQTKASWQIVLPNSLGTWTFEAYVTALDIPDLQVDKEASITGKLTITGAPAFAT